MDIDVRHVAELARIRLTAREVEELGPQLAGILDYVEMLQRLDTRDVPPTAHPHDVAMPLRPDVAENPERRAALLDVAPEVEAGLFVVPKVIEEA